MLSILGTSCARMCPPLLLLLASAQLGGCVGTPAPAASGGAAADGSARNEASSAGRPPGVGGQGSAPSSGGALPAQKPGPTRYEISHGERLLGVAEQGTDGRLTFTVDPGLPTPCLADELATKWAGYTQPATVALETGGVDADGTRWHGAKLVEQGSELYPYAMLNAFLGNDFGTEPPLPRSLNPEDDSKAKPSIRFEVQARPSRRATPDNFNRLPLGVFTVGPDGVVSLKTACEGEYLWDRLAKHFAVDEIQLSFAEPSGKSARSKAREPGDLRLTTEEHADVQIGYRRGEPEFFAALMTKVDHQFDVNLDVKPEPVLAASALNR